MPYRLCLSLILLIACFEAGFSQTQASAENQKHVIRVGIAVTMNRSNRQIIPAWERDQLVRELQHLRNQRKSNVVIEAIPLEGAARDDANPEAEKKACQYLVLTTLLNPSHGPGISGGPEGSQQSPVLIGNTNPSKTLAMNFIILAVGSTQTVAEGTSTAPVVDSNDVRAADDTMRLVAHRVASELRSSSAPKIE